jgi:protein-L-isoaspartate(D-aspartate) O-methyltransferase
VSPDRSANRQPPDPFAAARHRMVADQIKARGVRDARLLAAMERVPRHRFVPEGEEGTAYEDRPLSIGCGQTISQPYIVALMVEALATEPGSRILEVGAGCGYVSAILADLGCSVFAIEIVAPLANDTRERLAALGYDGVHLICGDGGLGWPEEAPFDGIIVSAAPAKTPPALLAQLGEAGRIVLPVGDEHQELWLYRRTPEGFRGEQLCEVRFVKMTGQAG